MNVIEDFNTYSIEGLEYRSEADILLGAIDEVSELSEGLETYVSLVEQFQATGGMSRQAALMVELGIQKTCANWVSPKNFGIGLEEFDENGNRVIATTFALESLKDTLKMIWDKIIEFINRFITAIKTTWNTKMIVIGTLNTRARLLKVNKILRRAKLEGKLKETEIKLSGQEIRNLTTKGKTDGICNGLLELSKQLKSSGGKNGPHVKVLLDTADKLEKINFSKETFESIFGKSKYFSGLSHYVSVLNSIGLHQTNSNRFKSNDKEQYFVSEPIIGDRIIVAETKTIENDVYSIRYSLADYNSTKAEYGDKIKALQPKEIDDYLDAIITISAAALTCKDNLTNLKEESNEYVKHMDSIVNHIKTHNDNIKDKELLSKIETVIKSSGLSVTSFCEPQNSLIAQAIASGKSTYNLCLYSLRNVEFPVTINSTSKIDSSKNEYNSNKLEHSHA